MICAPKLATTNQVTIVTLVQCSAFFVLFQKKCDDNQCVDFSSNRPARKLRALSYGDLAADYHTPHNWIPVQTKVRTTRPSLNDCVHAMN
jgi:hypothetical protein